MTRIATIIAREAREALPAFLLFFVAFQMIAVTKSVALEEHEITATGATVATVGALIVAKAILLVEKLPISRLFSERAISNILWKTFLFGAVATIFRGLEEIVHTVLRDGMSEYQAKQVAATIAWPHFFVMQMWLLSLLFLYCLAQTLARALGRDTLQVMLLGRSIEGQSF